MRGRAIENEVLDLLRSRAPLAQDREEIPDDLRLGPGGLGLDSISLVELLLECERRFGLRDVAGLLEGPPLTVGHLISHLRTSAGS